ncbi:MAG TPA: archaellin/type IV pilin N-terminal domain-containing protein, partial [Acidimicrobiales bacterium]|nr:archaellin/type IV pilin N-terminal domain-containing protein [Acidimicrobiales bacterium]
SWRKAQKRAVSPIIATILLVAITVVLAAVLYVLISGLTHGPGSTPIGSAFAVGNAKSATCTGTVATNGCAAGGKGIYNLTIEQSTVTFSSVLFEVITAGGGAYPAASGASFALVSVSSGMTAAYYTLTAAGGFVMPASPGWTYTSGYSSSSTLTPGLFTVVVNFNTVSAPTGQGLSLVAIGQGSYSGTTSPASLP